jgi:hypothetical protein
MEKIVYARLYAYSEHKNIIDEEQEGFRKYHSTTQALLRLVQNIFDGFNEKQHTLAVFLDLEKAFNSVWRDGLLVKLQRLGIRGKMWQWLSNFLTGRSARCVVACEMGDTFQTSVGLPQGSVLSPLLFNLYLTDIFQNIKSNSIKFADDGTIWKSGNDIQDLEKIFNTDLATINTWTEKLRMTFNLVKLNPPSLIGKKKT